MTYSDNMSLAHILAEAQSGEGHISQRKYSELLGPRTESFNKFCTQAFSNLTINLVRLLAIFAVLSFSAS